MYVGNSKKYYIWQNLYIKFVNFHMLRILDHPCVSWRSLERIEISFLTPTAPSPHCLLPTLPSPTRSLPHAHNPPTISLRFPTVWVDSSTGSFSACPFSFHPLEIFPTDVSNPEIPKPTTPITVDSWKVSLFPSHASYRSLPLAFYSSLILLCSTLVLPLKLWLFISLLMLLLFLFLQILSLSL